MGFGAKIQITTSHDLINDLILLDKKAPTVARQGMAKAMAVARKAAIALAPSDSNLLRRATKSRAYVTRSRDAVIGELLVRHTKTMVTRKGKNKPTVADPYYYAHLVELGTKPHSQTTTIRRRLKNGKIVEKQIVIRHPGSRPQPFLRPALESNVSAMESMLEEYISQALES